MATSYINEVVPELSPSGDDARDDRRLPIMSSLVHHQHITDMSGLDIPRIPTPPSAVEKTTRKYSLLDDLIESENAYVELLTGIIRVCLYFTPSFYILPHFCHRKWPLPGRDQIFPHRSSTSLFVVWRESTRRIARS